MTSSPATYNEQQRGEHTTSTHQSRKYFLVMNISFRCCFCHFCALALVFRMHEIHFSLLVWMRLLLLLFRGHFAIMQPRIRIVADIAGCCLSTMRAEDFILINGSSFLVPRHSRRRDNIGTEWIVGGSTVTDDDKFQNCSADGKKCCPVNDEFANTKETNIRITVCLFADCSLRYSSHQQRQRHRRRQLRRSFILSVISSSSFCVSIGSWVLPLFSADYYFYYSDFYLVASGTSMDRAKSQSHHYRVIFGPSVIHRRHLFSSCGRKLENIFALGTQSRRFNRNQLQLKCGKTVLKHRHLRCIVCGNNEHWVFPELGRGWSRPPMICQFSNVSILFKTLDAAHKLTPASRSTPGRGERLSFEKIFCSHCCCCESIGIWIKYKAWVACNESMNRNTKYSWWIER